MRYDAIPAELRSLKQWITVDIEDGSKIPYVAGESRKASSTRVEDWRTFEEVTRDVVDGKREHIGLVFTDNDPYFFLDLDEPNHPDQKKILSRLDTYAQNSVSGNGVHVIGRGKFIGKGRHPKNPAAGLFQTGRYALMTGDVLPNKTTIKDIPDYDLQTIYSWLAPRDSETYSSILVEVESKIPDLTVLQMGCDQWGTFEGFMRGEFSGDDQSSQDHAFICMLCELTPSNEQVRRLFAGSGMWNSSRADKKKDLTRYVDYSIKQIRGKLNNTEIVIHETEPDEDEDKIQELGDRGMIDGMPEGLIKRMADWVWKTEEYPLQEAATASAMSVMSTVGGRNFQTYTRSGLNSWIFLLAETGTGKNAYQNGISAIVKNVSDINTNSYRNFIKMFTGEIASGQALEDMLADSPRRMSYFPEVNDFYYNVTSPNGAPHYRGLKKGILNIYMQSGVNGYLPRRMKAKQKGEEANHEAILSPCLVIGGECTPGAFFKNLSLQEVSTGFIQRFTILESHRKSTSSRPSPHAGCKMPDDLAQELLEFFNYCDELEANKEFITVHPTKEARMMLEKYRNKKKDISLSRTADEATKQYCTRAGLKAIRYATQFAVAANFRNPILTVEHVEYAVKLVESSDDTVLNRFKSGSIGSGQVKQESDVMAAFHRLIKLSPKNKRKLGFVDAVAESGGVIPYNALKEQCVSLDSFATDRMGAITAFERTVKSLLASEILAKAPADVALQYGHRQGDLLGLKKI